MSLTTHIDNQLNIFTPHKQLLYRIIQLQCIQTRWDGMPAMHIIFQMYATFSAKNVNHFTRKHISFSILVAHMAFLLCARTKMNEIDQQKMRRLY